MRVEGGLWVVEATDAKGRAYRFTGRSLVNAAGPAVLDVLPRAAAPPAYRMRLVRGSHLVVPRLFDPYYAYFFPLPDGRIFFRSDSPRVGQERGSTCHSLGAP